EMIFDEQQKSLQLLPNPKSIAVVQRGTQTVVSDSTIFYNETTRRVVTRSDPSSGQADVRGTSGFDYNLSSNIGRVHNAAFPINNGETWYVTVKTAAI